jgi:hypothetical protein
MFAGEAAAKAGGANAAVGIGVIGLGDVAAIDGVGGRGHQLIRALGDVAGAQIVALCDPDLAHLEREAKLLKDRGSTVASYRDIRKLLDDKNADAVVVATPNHWHALATIWACQAGKDVYVEKPPSYNIWEGRQMVAAARKHGRMVQVGTQSRSSPALKAAFEYLRGGQLGAIRSARAIVYRPRNGIGKIARPTAESAADAPAVALRLALVLGDRQRRSLQQRRARHRHLPLGARTGQAGAARDQHRWTIRLRRRRPNSQHAGNAARLQAGATDLRGAQRYQSEPAELDRRVSRPDRRRGYRV